MGKVLPVLAIIFFLLFAGKQVFAAQFPTTSGFAVNVEVADSDANAGDILSITKEGLKRTSVSFDIMMFGVIAAAPVISVEPRSDNTKAVLSSGVTDVRVSTSAGNIDIGDYVTSSDKPGTGVKAGEPGYVLGKALAKYDNSSQDGLIPVDVNIGFAEVGIQSGGGLGNTIGRAVRNPQSFESLIRYILAAIVVILTIIGGTFAFIKFMSTGLLALGRNPLARVTIITGMVLSGLVVAVLAIVGLAVAAAIIGINNIFPK